MLDERLVKLYKEMDALEQKEAWLDLVPLYQRAIDIALSVYGEIHPETLAIYTEFGGLLRNLGRYEESLLILNKARACCMQLKGIGHPDYASSLVNIANLLRMMKQQKESEELFLQARAIYERTIGKKALVYVSLCNNLGLLYQDMGRYEESIPLHKHCLNILKNDPDQELLYGVTLNNLVEPYKHTGLRDQAIIVLKNAIAIFKKYIDHAMVLYAAGMNNLGTIYYEDGDYGKALSCFEEAVKISKNKLGKESESYKHSLINYTVTKEKVDAMSDLSCDSCFADSKASPAETTKTAPPEGGGCFDPNLIKGLELAERYFFDVCYPMLVREFPEHINRMAAGLIGEGSECYGFDDLISRDHDFGPSFQIYIPAADIPIYGKKLRAEVNKLPKSFMGFGERNSSTYGGGRIGLFSIEDFYDKFLSIHTLPLSNDQWLQMKDYPLSTVTNGKVFMDNLGEFTRIRQELLKHYPRDIQLKKLAAECMQIAQSGQYNLPRSLQREQYVAAHHALDGFIEHYASAIYLLNKTYKPYYKWEHEGLKKLPILGMTTHRLMEQIALLSLKDQGQQVVFHVEQLSGKLIEVLKGRGLSSSGSDFLLDHGPEILKRIEDETLKRSNPWG